MSGGSVPEEVAEDEEKGGFLVDLLSDLNQLQETEETKKKKKDKKKDKKISDKVKYSQKYLKELIDETKGGIKSYQIINKEILEKFWEDLNWNLAKYIIPEIIVVDRESFEKYKNLTGFVYYWAEKEGILIK